MAIKIANTAAGSASLQPSVKAMTDFENRLFRYHTGKAMLRTMQKNGILTLDEADKCCAVLAEKYGISLCSIFR